MALLYAEGFDDGLYNVRGICPAVPSTTYGRNGTKGIYVGDDPVTYYDVRSAISITGTTLIFGYGVSLNQVGSSPNYIGKGTNMPVVQLLGGTDLTGIEVVVNGNTVSTASGDVPTGWNFIEVKVVYDASVGTVEIRVNGQTKATGTSLNTGTAPTTVKLNIGGTSATDMDQMWVDDIYVADGSGSFNNDFFGDMRVVALLPNGNGNTSGMVGSDGNSTDNYLLVDDNPPDTADYVGGGTEGDKDTYAMGDLTGTPTVLGVLTAVYAAKSDTGTKYLRPIVRSGTTDYAGTSIALSTDYSLLEEVHDTDPDTATTWTASGVNAMQVGQEVRDS